MAVATLGQKNFVVDSTKIYTFEGLEFEYGKNITDDGTGDLTDKRKPKIYYDSIKILKVVLKMKLDCRFHNIDLERQQWKEMSESTKVYPLYIGKTRLTLNKFNVSSVKFYNIQLDNKGNYLKADLDITLTEYAGKSDNIEHAREDPYQYAKLVNTYGDSGSGN